MKNLKIDEEQVQTLLDARFIKVFDLQYQEGKHYFDATRRDKNRIMATMSDDEFRNALPDAVSCAVILHVKDQEPRMYLTKEYRYPTGRFLLSVPAGLIDREDENEKNPEIITTIREIKEETGIDVDLTTDKITMVNPLLLSSPGMTDESNAMMRVDLYRDEVPAVSQDGAVGSELFDGQMWITKDEAREFLKKGRDDQDNFYSAITWIGLMIFVSDLW